MATHVTGSAMTPDQLSDLLRSLPGAIVWQADPWALELSFVSDSARDLLGFPPEEWKRQRGFLKDHVHPADWSRLLDALYLVVFDGGVHSCQHRMIRSDGSVLWVQTTVRRSDRSNGSQWITGMSADITVVKQSEQLLRNAEKHARSLIDNIRDYAVFMLRPDGTVDSWNTGAQRVQAYASSEIVGLHFSLFWPVEERNKGTPGRLLHRAELDGRSEYNGFLVRKGGELFWATVSLSAVKDEHGQLRGFSNVARDLSEQKKTEQSLRDSEQHFRLLVDSLQDYGVFMLSVSGTVASWNRGSHRLKGYRADEIVGASLASFFPLEEVDKRTPQRLLDDAMLLGKATYEGRLLRKGGRPFWANLTVSAVEDEAGHLIGFANVARDVSDRKQAEDAVRESEERIRRLVDSVQDYGFISLSPDGRIVSWSRGAELHKGYRSEEIVGEPVSRMFPRDAVERGIPEALIRRASTEGHAEYDGWIVRKGGGRFWANLSVSADTDADGQLRGLSVVTKDLTERMRVQRGQALLAEVGAIVAASLDHRATLERVAQLAARELAEWCCVEMLHDDAIEPFAVANHDPLKERALSAALRPMPAASRRGTGIAARVVESGTPELHAEGFACYDNVSKVLGLEDPAITEEIIDRAYMCVPLTARGKTFGAMVFIAPLGTRFGRADLFLAEELARRAALSVDNARLYEQAQRAIRSRQDVLAVVSHDLRNPLNVIAMSAAQLASDAHGEPDSATVVKAAATIGRAAHAMTRMIRDLLDFASIEAGRLRLELAEVDPGELVREAVELMRPIGVERGVIVDVASARLPADVRVRCDRDRIVQVFSNLIGNAIKFTGEQRRVTIDGQVDGSRAVFKVTDYGAGIPADFAPHVFERYWRGTSASREGLGLGLAISKGIIESHGGEIWIDASTQNGTTFAFALPVCVPP